MRRHAMMPECEYRMNKRGCSTDLNQSCLPCDLMCGGHCQETNVRFRQCYFYCKSFMTMVSLSSLKEAEKPFCERLHRVRDLMDRSKVSIEEVISELGQYRFIFDFIMTFSFLDLREFLSPIHPFLLVHCLFIVLSRAATNDSFHN